MKCLFFTALVITFVLAFFCQSGSALKCYKCSSSPCENTVTCPAGKDACIAVNLAGVGNVSDCWKYSECNLDKVGAYYKSKSFGFRCCTGNLCNAKPFSTDAKPSAPVQQCANVQCLEAKLNQSLQNLLVRLVALEQKVQAQQQLIEQLEQKLNF